MFEGQLYQAITEVFSLESSLLAGLPIISAESILFRLGEVLDF